MKGLSDYFIVDGPNKYGPASLELLNFWALEGRVVPTSILEEVATQQRLQASQLFGLTFPLVNPGIPPIVPREQAHYPYAEAPGPSNYYRPPGFAMDPTLVKRASSAMTSGILTTVCIGCMPIGIVSIVFASQAQKAIREGNSLAAEARIRKANTWAIVSLGVWAVVLVIELLLAASGQLQ